MSDKLDSEIISYTFQSPIISECTSTKENNINKPINEPWEVNRVLLKDDSGQ